MAEEGWIIKSQSVAHIPLMIGTQTFTWPVYVTLIGDDMLLGCDLFHFIYVTLLKGIHEMCKIIVRERTDYST